MFYVPEGGGVQRYLKAKHEWLRRNTTVTHTILAPGKADNIAKNGIVTLKTPPLFLPNGYRFPIRLKKWKKRLIELAPDLIEVGDAYGPAWASIKAGQQLGVPVAGFYHSDLVRLIGTRLGRNAENATARYVRHLYREFDIVITPSQFIARKLQAIGIQRVICQSLGVDTEQFHPQRRDPDLRKKLGLPENTRLLIFAGRFTKEKKIPVLLSAFSRLGNPYHLLLVGHGMRIAPRPNVTVWNYQHNEQDLARLIASCDAFAHAGADETFGLVIIEAMASGLPIVGINGGGVAELVDERCGILVPPGNSKAFAEAIDTLYINDLRRMGEEAREKVKRLYSWNRVMHSLLSLYQHHLLINKEYQAIDNYAYH